MCYAKPGPRCSPHAKAKLFAAKKHLAEARETGTPQQLQQATREYKIAARLYDSTNEGQKRLQHALNTTTDTTTRHKLQRRLHYAHNLHTNQRHSYKQQTQHGTQKIAAAAAAQTEACQMLLAENYARYAHRGQYRKDNTEFVEHPVRVAEYVRKFGGSREQILAAYLHDTVEDTDATIETIRKHFGPHVAHMVDALSHREGETYNQSIRRLINTCPDAILVKLGDNADNSSEDQLKVFRPNFSDYMRRVKKYETARIELIRAHYETQGYKITQ